MKPLKIAAEVVSWYEGILGILAGLYILVSGIDQFYFRSDGTVGTVTGEAYQLHWLVLGALGHLLIGPHRDPDRSDR